MFENLTERLSRTVTQLRSKGRLTEDGIRATLREVRIALLEADVALPVVQTFVREVREKAVGQEILKSLTPGQAMVKLVHDELVQIMGVENEALDLRAQPPVPVLMAGLQGSGKTTTTAKLARLLIEQEKKRVMVVSCDVYRPAAIEQLKTLAGQVGAVFQPSSVNQKPAEIAAEAMAEARRQMCDVLLVDTAGRLHIDEDMMAEIRQIHAAVEPHETLFVVDAMTGQDAANTAAAFNDALPLTGIVLTKTDGDARGGAALSVRHITGKPIKFLGSGEKTEALQPFHPERLASRILGMGDVLSLVEEVHRKVDQQEAEKLVKKIRRGKGFDLEDFRSQLEQMQSMGGLGGLVDKLPGMSNLPDNVKSQVDDRQTQQMVAIINSMTPHERRFPDVIRGSRKKRIAMGSGTQIQAVNRLLKQHAQMQKMMKKMGKGGMARMMRKVGKLGGQMPPGKFPGGKMPF
ncbi:MAG: signal recognition particle protein [Xanthomonadales bacterium]|nr:signal recognition particle protein [Gammaproteobacteria bacterium]MBT8053841.1 signal recognition particle protein [Gammaproteobacteria bacterium]NND56422.1 signal recognition particle protein [Xanthomonadales bacterium]NNK51808.1 signal recognition particle protein [Xanthomonadales bacterium]